MPSTLAVQAVILCLLAAPSVVAQVASSAQSSADKKITFCYLKPEELYVVSAPRFDRYTVPTENPFRPAGLNLKSNSIVHAYRTRLRAAMKQPPNFAGHYRVTVWGCGTSCIGFAVVNLRTGRVITTPEVSSVINLNLREGTFLPGSNREDERIQVRTDSRLLVLVGMMNEDDAMQGAYYYLLKNEKLVLIHKTLARPTECVEESED